MNCDEMLELISGHVDGENTEAQERQLQKHLESCAECRALLQAYEQIDTGLLELTEEPPERLAQGVMYRIGLEKKGQKRFAFGRWTALGAAAVLALMLAGGALTLPNFQNHAANTTADTAAPITPGDHVEADDAAQSKRAKSEQASGEETAETPSAQFLAPTERETETVTGTVGDASADAATNSLTDLNETVNSASVSAAENQITLYLDGEACPEALMTLLADYPEEPMADGSKCFLLPREAAEEVLETFSGRTEVGTLQDGENRLVIIP